MKKKILAMLLGLTMICGLVGCGSTGTSSSNQESTEQTSDSEVVELNIAYQYGLAYAPLAVMQDQKIIEDTYKELTGKEVKVNWNQMSSGPDINTGISSGSIDIGFMGVAPAITGVSKQVGYKIFTNLSGQSHGLVTSVDGVEKLEDLIGSDKQIALVNIGSIQHIILAKALADNGFDAHALDANIVGMKHPDGMASLESGAIPCHLTSSPYIFMERESDKYTELTEVKDAWGEDHSFIVGVAATKMHDENPELYQAVCDSVSKAIDYINGNLETVAELTCELDGNSKEDELKYLKLGVYSTETKGVFEIAKFMGENGFIDASPASYEELVFDNVVGD